MQIRVDKNKCVGCRTCELACSFHNSGEINPASSQIRIYFDGGGNVEVKVPARCACAGTDQPPCAGLCPAGAVRYYTV